LDVLKGAVIATSQIYSSNRSDFQSQYFYRYHFAFDATAADIFIARQMSEFDA